MTATKPATAATRDQLRQLADLRPLFDLSNPDLNLGASFRTLRRRHLLARWYYLGYPVAYDLSFPHTRRLLSDRLYNNIGTELLWHPGGQHAMEVEIGVLDWLCQQVGIPSDDRWGHVTTGGTEGNYTGIRHGHHRYPHAVLVHSRTAHYSVAKAAHDLKIPTFAVAADKTGAMDLLALDDTLAGLVAGRPAGSRQVIVVATWGTTLTGADDDVPGINAVLDSHNIRQRYVHLDGALSGIPKAAAGHADLTKVDSLSVSAYKFLAVPMPSGLVLGPGRIRPSAGDFVGYTGTHDLTVTGVRSGLPAAMMAEAIVQCGDVGHQARAQAGRDLAVHTVTALNQVGVAAWRNPDALFHVVMPTPPPAVTAKWTLASHDDNTSHLLCVPGVVRAQIDEFVADYATARAAGIPGQYRNLFAGLLTGKAAR